eukprot:jgi/Mesvir1/12253/Mv00470-RA.2
MNSTDTRVLPGRLSKTAGGSATTGHQGEAGMTSWNTRDGSALATGTMGSRTEINYDKIVALFMNPHATELHQRHIAAVERICRENDDGFPIRDLPYMDKVVSHMLQFVKEGKAEIYAPPLCRMLRVASLPFVRRSSTDDFKMLTNISNFLATVGQLFIAQVPSDVQICAAQMLEQFASAHSTRVAPQDLAGLGTTPMAERDTLGGAGGVTGTTRVPPAASGGAMGATLAGGMAAVDLASAASASPRQYYANQRLVERSGVVRSAVKGLSVALDRGDLDLLDSLLRALLQFSRYEVSAMLMMQESILLPLAKVLRQGGIRGPLTFSTVELLWNVLELTPASREMLTIGGGNTPAADNNPYGSSSSDPDYLRDRRPETAPEAGSPMGDPAWETGAGYGQQGHREGVDSPLQGDYWSASGEGRVPDAGTEGDLAPGGNDGAGEGVNATGSGGNNYCGDDANRSANIGLAASAAGELVGVLAELLAEMFSGGYRQADKELRNELLLVAHLLSKARVNMEAARETLLPLLVAAAVTPEILPFGDIIKPFALTTEPEDYEMKQLTWAVVGACCKADTQSLEYAVEGGFVACLLSYIDPVHLDAPGGVHSKWSRGQLRTLQAQALTLLIQLIPAKPSVLYEGGASDTPDGRSEDRVMLILRFAQAMAADTGSATVTTSITGTLTLQTLALRLLLACCPLLTCQGRLGDLGAVPVCLELFSDPRNATAVRMLGAQLVSALCKAHDDNQRLLRKADGLRILTEELCALAKMEPATSLFMTVAVVDCTWNCILNNRRNLARFIAAGGLDALLTLLEATSEQAKPLLLGCIADILENPKSHVFFHEWRSSHDADIGAAHLILELWRAEERRREMVTDSGVLANARNPFEGGLKKEEAFLREFSTGFRSAARRQTDKMVDRAKEKGDIMSKVYAVFKALGFRSLKHASLRDAATLCAVENYVRIRHGEVWHKVADELQAEGIKPVSVDMARIRAGMRVAEDVAAAVIAAQKELLQEVNKVGWAGSGSL